MTDHDHEPVIGYDGVPYTVGDRVELHPSLDMWMQGARFGVVVSLSLTKADRVHVKLDKHMTRLFGGHAEAFKRVS